MLEIYNSSMTEMLVQQCKVYIKVMNSNEALEIAKETVKKLDGSGKESLKKML